MKINLKIFYILVIFLMFFPSFRLNLGSTHFLIFFIVLLPLLLLSFIAFPKMIIQTCNNMYKYTPIRFLNYFVLWIFGSGFLLMLFGYYKPLHFFNVLFMTILCLYILPYILPSIIFPKIINFRAFIKGYVFSLFILFLIGIVFYIGYELDIGIIKEINNFFCNARLVDQSDIAFNETQTRAACLFEEPGWYAEFIFLNLPFLYGFLFSKKRLFTKAFTNTFFKTVLIPLAYISLILTKSPIWIIFSIILTILYILKNYIKFIIKYPVKTFTTIFIVFMLVCLLYKNINLILGFLEDSTLTSSIAKRIQVALYSFGSFERFVLHENSLATRVISYMAAFKLFISHPITGAGWINSQYHILPYLMQLKVPFSDEIIFHINMSQTKGSMHINASILSTLLSESGIVGTFLFYLFLFKTIQYTRKISKFYYGVDKIFISSLAISYIAMISVSFYTGLLFICYPLWFYLGLINPFIINLKSKKLIRYNNETNSIQNC